MGQDDSDLKVALDQARRRLADLDRQALHLRALYDTARELAQLTDPAGILETFLLMTMGPLGTGSGFVQLFDLSGGAAEFRSRGLAAGQDQALRAGPEEVRAALFDEDCGHEPGRVEVVGGDLSRYPFLPPGTDLVVRWCGPLGHAGVLGLGAPLSGKPRGPQDEECVVRLVGILVDALRGALAVRGLGATCNDLARRNRELERTLGQAGSMQAELDKQVFRLNSLYEATMELSGIVETRGLLDVFLLTVMGVFGSREGGVYLHGDATPALVLRGARAVPESIAALEASQRGLAKFFSDVPGGGEQHLGQDLSVVVLSGAKQLAGASFPFEARVAVAFSVDGNVRGLMALGERLDGEAYGAADHALLRAHVGKVLSHIRNALAFEEIIALNASLTQRNEELNQLLREISAYKVELSDVARAKERILSVVRRETSRSEQVRRMDFALILVLALVIGLVFNLSNPEGVSLRPASWSREPLPTIDAEWLRLRVDNGSTLVVDARPAELYARSRVRGAVNLPRSLFEFVYTMRFASLDPEARIVVYGRTVSSLYDEDVAAMLRERGFADVAVLEGGLAGWRAKGYPVEYGP